MLTLLPTADPLLLRGPQTKVQEQRRHLEMAGDDFEYSTRITGKENQGNGRGWDRAKLPDLLSSFLSRFSM